MNTSCFVSFPHSFTHMQGFVASVYVLAGDVEALIKSFNAAEWVFFTLVFAGLLIMRVTYRHEKRVFKVRRWHVGAYGLESLDSVPLLCITIVYRCG